MVLTLDCSRTKSESGRRPLGKSMQEMMVARARVTVVRVVTSGHVLDIFEGATIEMSQWIERGM